MLIRSFLRGAFSCFLVSLLLSANFCHADEESTVEVVGLGECADCDSINLKNSQAFSGLRVTIDCKVENGEMKRRGSGVLDEQGNFKVNLPNHLVKDEKLNEECYAQLHSASAAPCPTHNGLESSKVIFKTKNNGKHTFGLKGKLKFSPVTCASLTFWHHHFNYPPLPQLPPLPKWKLPPLKSFHHHPYFPPKVYYPPKQLPPPVPEYKPPPTPEYKPPPKALPPPAPEYKPPPKVVPPPEKKPCPPPAEKKPKPPVYKPTPKPPVYKPTPKPPVYKPTPKPPVYKPTPKPPVYTPTPKPPVYTPTPKPPVYKPPVYTPTPKPPAYNPKPKPPVYLPPHVPIYKPYPKKPCPPLPKLPPFPKIPPKYFHHPKFGKKWPPLPPHYPIH